jgi:D-sedoheptulose 7-phosphate isomerase
MLDSYISSSIAVLESLRTMQPEIRTAVNLMTDCLSNSGKILACGNGGSAAEAAHFATELLCRFERDRPSLPAWNLSADGSFLTATGNDYDFNSIFSRQIDGLARVSRLLYFWEL